MYKSFSDILKETASTGKRAYRLILENEMALTGVSEELFYEKLKTHYEVMKTSAHKALEQAQSMTGMLASGMSAKQYAYKSALCGDFVNKVMALALSSSEVNASMGRICAAPTAGASGILPAVLIAGGEETDSGEKQILNALSLASGVGAIIASNATLSGAEGGCQAECGAAAAMAAAAAVFLKGGTDEQAFNAVSFALINCMGLICDPVAGLVQLPCAFRNASQAVNALVSADLALAGQPAYIPADEVVSAMYKVGKRLPYELKETSLGGIANTPAAKKISEELWHKKIDDSFASM